MSLTRLRLASALALFALTGKALGAVRPLGPRTDLEIVNKVIAPDGFSRDTVLAGGTFPGPLIQGFKVRY